MSSNYWVRIKKTAQYFYTFNLCHTARRRIDYVVFPRTSVYLDGKKNTISS